MCAGKQSSPLVCQSHIVVDLTGKECEAIFYTSWPTAGAQGGKTVLCVHIG